MRGPLAHGLRSVAETCSSRLARVCVPADQKSIARSMARSSVRVRSSAASVTADSSAEVRPRSRSVFCEAGAGAVSLAALVGASSP